MVRLPGGSLGGGAYLLATVSCGRRNDPCGATLRQLCPSHPAGAAAEDGCGGVVVSGVGNGAGGVKGDLLESCGDAATLLVTVGA